MKPTVEPHWPLVETAVEVEVADEVRVDDEDVLVELDEELEVLEQTFELTGVIWKL